MKIKKTISAILLSLMLSVFPLASAFADTPYWSNEDVQVLLEDQADYFVDGDPDQTPNQYVLGSMKMMEEAEFMASTIETDILSIIKQDIADDAKREQIKDLTYKIYRPVDTFGILYEPSSDTFQGNENEYFAQYGILNYLEDYLTICQSTDDPCASSSWFLYPNGSEEANGPEFEPVFELIDFASQRANLSRSLFEKIGLDPINTEDTHNGYGLFGEIEGYLQDLETNEIFLEPQTVAMLKDGTYIDYKGNEVASIDEALQMNEYAVAGSYLYNIISPQKSMITAQDYTLWGNVPANHMTLLDVLDDYQNLSYQRAKLIYEKSQIKSETQKDLADSIWNEINGLAQNEPSSPFDMETILRNLEYQRQDLDILGGQCLEDEVGYTGCLDPDTQIEPIDYEFHQERMSTINELLNTAVESILGNEDGSIPGYKQQYENSPNLSNPDTNASFQNAVTTLIDVEKAMMDYASELKSEVSYDIVQDQNAIDILKEAVGSYLDSSSIVGALWDEIRQAMVSLTNSTMNNLTDNLNFGLSDLDQTSQVYEIYSIAYQLSNILLVLIIALTGLSITMEWNIGRYNLRQLIPRFIIAAVLVQVSYFIFRTIIDTSLIFSNVFLEMGSKLSYLNIEVFSRTASYLDGSNVLGLSSAAPKLLFGPLLSNSTASLTNSVFQNDIATVIILMIIFSLTSAINILLVIRTAALWLMIIASPILFMLSILPGTASLIKKFFRAFISLTLIAPSIIIIYLIGISLASSPLTNDILRVMIGMGTFGLMLMTPYIFSFLSKLLETTLKHDNEPVITTQNTKETFRETYKERNTEKSETKETNGRPNLSMEYAKSLKNIRSNAINPSNAHSSLADLPVSSIPVAIKSGILLNFKPNEFSKIFKKMTPDQQRAVLTTYADKDKNGNSMWPDDLKNIINGLVSTSEIQRIINTSRLVKTTRVNKTMDINQIISQGSSKNDPTFQAKALPSIESLIFKGKNEEAKSRMANLVQLGNINPEIVGGLFNVEKGIAFMSSLSLSDDVDDKKLAQKAIRQYYQSAPEEILEINKMTGSSNKAIADGAKIILESGIEGLGKALEINPASEELKGVATKLIESIPKGLAKILHNNTGDTNAKAAFIAKGLTNTDNVSAKNAFFERATAEDLILLANEVQIPGIDSLIMKKKLSEKAASFAKNPSDSSLKGNLSGVSLSGADIKSDSVTSSDMSLNTMGVKIDGIDQATINNAAGSEIKSLIGGNIQNLTTKTLQALIERFQSNKTAFKGALQNVVDNYNANLGNFDGETTLQSGVAGLLKNYRFALGSSGFTLKADNIDIQNASAQIAELKSGTSWDQNTLLTGMLPLLATKPSAITEAHIDSAIGLLDTAQLESTPIVNGLLAPDSVLSDSLILSGMNTLLKKSPELALPGTLHRLLSSSQLRADEIEGLVGTLKELFADPSKEIPLDARASALLGSLHNESADLGILDSSVSADGNISAKLMEQATPQELEMLPNDIIANGLSRLIATNPKAITPEHIGLLMKKFNESPGEFGTILKTLTDSFNESDSKSGAYDLTMPSLLTMVAGETDLKQNGFELNPEIQNSVVEQARDHAIDIGGFGSLEQAIKDIPRALKTPPGSASTPESAQTVVQVDATSTITENHSKESNEIVRESVQADSISKAASKSGNKNDENTLSDNDALNDYAANVKESDRAPILTPKLDTEGKKQKVDDDVLEK